MKKLLSLFALTASLVFADVIPASARPATYLSPDNLWKQADVVVIATAISSEDSSKFVDPDVERPISVTTKFDVQLVLKGKVEKKTDAEKLSISVRHYRFSDDKKEFIINGPIYIKFDLGSGTRYLMFLSGKTQDDLAPLTGQWDPDGSLFRVEGFHSVRETKAPPRIDPPKNEK